MKDIILSLFLSLFPFSTHFVILDDSLGCLTCREWSRKGSPARIPPPIPFNSFVYFFSLFFGARRGASGFLLILRTWRTNYLRWVARIRIRSRPQRRRWSQLSWVAAQVGTTPDLRKEKRMLKRYTLAIAALEAVTILTIIRLGTRRVNFILFLRFQPVNTSKFLGNLESQDCPRNFDIFGQSTRKDFSHCFDNTIDHRFITEYQVERHTCALVNLLTSNDLYRVT